MSSVATLKKKAKTGDADALKQLIELTKSKDQEIVIAAAGAIGTLGTKAGWDAVRTIVLESENGGARFVVMQKLDRAMKKDKLAVETLIAMCSDPRVDKDDYPIACLANLVHGDPGRAKKDPRILKSLRRALDAEHVYAQESAVMGLIDAGDTESLERIVDLVDTKKTGPDLFYFIGEAIVKLGGTQAHLDRLNTRAA